MAKMSTRMLVEAGIMIALAQILSYVVIFQAPYGGSITAGSMVPILIFALRWGGKNGIMAGTVYGLLQFILGPKYSYHILSILLDYVIAFGILGIAGYFKNSKGSTMLGITLAIVGRFVCHLLSGVILFASYAPEGMNPWVYSIIYNGAYLLPELIISLSVVVLLYKAVVANGDIAAHS